MGSNTVATVPTEYANSLAARIERELNAALAADGIARLELSTNSKEARDRRRLFVAIARGVLGFLADNDDAITVNVSGSGTRQVNVNVTDVPSGGSS